MQEEFDRRWQKLVQEVLVFSGNTPPITKSASHQLWCISHSS